MQGTNKMSKVLRTNARMTGYYARKTVKELLNVIRQNIKARWFLFKMLPRLEQSRYELKQQQEQYLTGE